jgi:hypothetical protein
MKTKNLSQKLFPAIAAAIILCPLSGNARVVYDAKSKMTTLLGHAPAVMSIVDAEKQGLSRAEAKFQPWAGSFWPDINGGITNHYRDHGGLGAKLNFLTRYDMAKARFRNDHKDVCEKFGEWDIEKLSKKLSPSEKYDLLLGNTNFEFTKAIMEEMDFRSDYRITTKKVDGSESDDSKDEGNDNQFVLEDQENAYSKYDSKELFRYWRKKGSSLAYWSGICDGWGPASIYLPRPTKPVTVRGAAGHLITFYPDDIKALGSYLFARTNTPYFTTMNYKFAGRKCSESGSPKLDEHGYVQDVRCNDLDAGVWHLSLLNRIGKDKLGFIFDIDNNLKINNHPIASYEIEYFNPKTGEKGGLKESIVQRQEIADGYAFRRDPANPDPSKLPSMPKVKYIVGVKSKINYMNYYWPEENREEQFDDAGKDNNKKRKKSKEFVYDLELDENYNILGGEWGNRFDDSTGRQTETEDGSAPKYVQYADQPDFIWMAAPQAMPRSEMSEYAIAGVKKDESNPRPFDNMNWAWDGKSRLPEDWINAAKADMTWAKPVFVDDKNELDSKPEARNSVLKSAQPLSHIVYYLFDKSRLPNQK